MTTVTRIVTDHGFWELGRFSVAYRGLFGESPSETLQRPAQQLEVHPSRPLVTAADQVIEEHAICCDAVRKWHEAAEPGCPLHGRDRG